MTKSERKLEWTRAVARRNGWVFSSLLAQHELLDKFMIVGCALRVSRRGVVPFVGGLFKPALRTQAVARQYASLRPAHHTRDMMIRNLSSIYLLGAQCGAQNFYIEEVVARIVGGSVYDIVNAVNERIEAAGLRDITIDAFHQRYNMTFECIDTGSGTIDVGDIFDSGSYTIQYPNVLQGRIVQRDPLQLYGWRTIYSTQTAEYRYGDLYHARDEQLER